MKRNCKQFNFGAAFVDRKEVYYLFDVTVKALWQKTRLQWGKKYDSQ